MNITSLPEIQIFFERPDGKAHSVAKLFFNDYRYGIEKPTELHLEQSFGNLIIEISGTQNKNTAILINGNSTSPRKTGGILTLRFPLDRDIGFHRISAISPPKHAITIDISIEHHYRPKGLASEKGIPKWSVTQFKGELQKTRTVFENSKQREIQPDPINKGTRPGEDNTQQNQLLFQLIGRLASILSIATPNDLRVDFHKLTAGDLDRESILTSIKQNHHHLVETNNGCIKFNGRNFSTDLNQRTSTKTAKIDLSRVLAVIAACSSKLRSSDAPAISSFLLSEIYEEIKFRFPHNNQPNETSIGGLLDQQMHSPTGASIQNCLRTLISLVGKIVGRDPIDNGMLWIKQSIQDRDVYQASVFFCCAKAFGFSLEDILSSDGVVSADNITVANTNTSKGLSLFRATVHSWRSNTIQPSEYRPDTLIIIDNMPVIIDAKFRISKSVWQLAEPEGIKDVQAYMDDFQLNSAIIITPIILNPNFISLEGFAAIESPSKQIFIVEMQDSDSLVTQGAIREAVGRAICRPKIYI